MAAKNKSEAPAEVVAPEAPVQIAATGQVIETAGFEIVDNTDSPHVEAPRQGEESEPVDLGNGMILVSYN